MKQDIIVYILIGAATLYSLSLLYKTIIKRKDAKDCNSGCDGCPLSNGSCDKEKK